MLLELRVQHAKVATLEKQNRDLSWQVAMLADKVTAPVAPQRAAPGSVPTATKVNPDILTTFEPRKSVLCWNPCGTLIGLGFNELFHSGVMYN